MKWVIGVMDHLVKVLDQLHANVAVERGAVHRQAEVLGPLDESVHHGDSDQKALFTFWW